MWAALRSRVSTIKKRRRIEQHAQHLREHVAAFLEACGLSLGEQRNFRHRTDRKHAMGGFATAIV
jgi:hypothetical protein